VGLRRPTTTPHAALAATPALDLADPDLRALAAELSAGAGGPREVVARAVAWVHRELDKELATDLSLASQVLARRAGDCTEHTLLFVALARAAGVPARELSGLVYLGDEVGRFGWHAWAEVAIDGRWVMVDPTFGQPVADVGHLTLGVGDDSDWIMTLGSLALAVDEAR
jgi:transglutaminase-like putative cysteine protease